MSTMLSLPENCRTAVLNLLRDILPEADEKMEHQCLQEVAPLYDDDPGMSEASFLLRARGAVYAFAQRQAVSHAQHDPEALRKHILWTLRRCLPVMVSENMVDRCLAQLMQTPDDDDPMYTGAIHQFAAAELLAEPKDDDPMTHRLHESALRHLPLTRPVTRDDIRLVSLDALSDPTRLPDSCHSGFLRLRLGLNGSRMHSCEEIAARMHLPVHAVRSIEANALRSLTRSYQLRRYFGDD